jgi:hypothetical protein
VHRSQSTPNIGLPRKFIDETLATIDLLVPLTKSSCNSWLAKEIESWGLDRNLIHRDPPDHRKSSYGFWQEKLQAIEDNFDRTKPRSIFQWWHDTRDMQQWWAFWLVIIGIFLTVIFGLIQSVTGVLQVVMASRQGG